MMFNLIKESFKPKHLKKASLLLVLMLFLTFSGCSFNNESNQTASSQVTASSSLAVSTNLNTQDQVTLVAIEFNKLPTKLTYTPNEVITTSGGELRLFYSNYDFRIIKMNDNMIDITRLDISETGTKPITIKYQEGSLAKYISYNVEIVPFVVNINSVTLDIVSSDVLLTQSVQLNPIIAPLNGLVRDIKWSSSKPLIATVDNNGLVTPLNAGEVIITVTVNNQYSAVSRLNILQNEIKEVVEEVTQVVILDATANLTFNLTTPAGSGSNTITVNQAASPKTVSINVANNISSVVITASKLEQQSVAISGTNSSLVTAGGDNTTPTYAINSTSVAAGGGTLLFTLTISESNQTNIVYNVTIIVAAPPQPIVTTNLVINLDAGNTASYSGTGSTWTNLVNNTQYSIINGTFDSGNGGSIVFNGTNTYLSIGTPLSGGTNFTKEAWVNADVVDSSHNILSSASNVFWNSGSTLGGGVANSYSVVTSTNFPTLVWRHVVLTFDDTNDIMRLYINGVQVSEKTNVTQSYISEIERIGAHFVNGNLYSFWDGKIAQVRVYSAALTGAQVLQNFNSSRARYGQ